MKERLKLFLLLACSMLLGVFLAGIVVFEGKLPATSKGRTDDVVVEQVAGQPTGQPEKPDEQPEKPEKPEEQPEEPTEQTEESGEQPEQSAQDLENQQTTQEPTGESDTYVDLMMVGDMLLHDYLQENGLYPDGTYNYDHWFANIASDIQEADLALVNQEVIIGGNEIGIQNYPRFNCRYEVADALAKAGFNVILHATNHTIDQGVTGVENCMNYWDNRYPDVTYLGIHRTYEEYANDIYVYEKNGFRIAILNYTYGLNGLSLPSEKTYMVEMLSEDKVISDIQKAKAMSDFVIVCPHWGTEYVFQPDNYQKRWAQLFADNGVNLVLGTHPHVVEPVEWVVGAEGNQTLVYYSLGNYISCQNRTEMMLGAMAKVRLRKDSMGNVSIVQYQAVPLVTHWGSGYASLTTYRLENYTEELAQACTFRRTDSSFSLTKLWQLWNDTMN